MKMKFARRDFSKLTLGAIAVCGNFTGRPLFAQESGVINKAMEVERRLGARLGLAILDDESGRRWTYQADQRFPMCSTFKVLASSAFLARVDRGEDSLDRRVIISEDDLVSYSPLTETRVAGQGMTMAEICEAALTLSDNTAGNKILESIGGPSGLTEFARSIGDAVSRLDRWETELNEALVGDERDTTSPHAMTQTLRELLLGDTLTENSRQQLAHWMTANKTGDSKLRAGLPLEWTIGDKTGGGNNGTMADVAIVWPVNRPPLIVAVYMTETTASFDDCNAGIAEIASALGEEVQRLER
ncbi:MAG: class A beta-lactamase [SAR86 cluster bacterium]|uniref:beta-lactamase n=1 Tax=SAR86 cluster bacterium TaxID=2030880 RepID=A0A2A4XI21_9GAMM|nr:MAG: class A beta-lactamase [SAR86 cluster bacterium]